VDETRREEIGRTASSFFRTIRRHLPVALLTTGAVLVCLLLGSIFFVDVVHERDVATMAAGREAANLAESLALQVSDTLEATNCALFGLGERAAGGPAPGGSLREWMAMQVMMVPRLHELLVIDERGRLRASSAIGAPESTPASLANLVTYHREDADPGLYVSGPVRLPGGKRWLVLASRRIDAADGRFAGVAVAELQATYFAGLYKNVDVGPRGTIALVNDGGIIVVRKPFALMGTAFRNSVPSAANGSAGLIVARSPLDGINRLSAFQQLSDYPFAVWVSVAPDDFLAQWRASARANGIAVTAIVTLIGLLATALGMQFGKRKRAEETLARLAWLDGLTGVANRRSFDAALETEWLRGVRDGSVLALLLIDVDNFKAYNDRYGHVGGDKILIAVARTIRAKIFRDADLAARYGGEEFAVILPATPAQGALEVAERIRTAIAELGEPHSGSAAQVVTVSIGVAALTPSTFVDMMTLVSSADQALYAAKSNGRNRSLLVDEHIVGGFAASGPHTDAAVRVQ
jgi:diguanylate cyclase (GGDEF)-like protein